MISKKCTCLVKSISLTAKHLSNRILKRADAIPFVTQVKLAHNDSYMPNLLVTTGKKLTVAYDDAQDYIRSLLNEKLQLLKLFNDETLSSERQDAVKRLSYLNDLDKLNAKIQKNLADIAESSEMLRKLESDAKHNSNDDDEMIRMLRSDLSDMQQRLYEQKYDMIQFILPEELEDKEDAVMDLSAGVGGSESRIFCGELLEMYKSYAGLKSWSFTPLMLDSENGMLRKASVEISGSNVFKYLKFESGVHRVQRVPKTEV